MKKYIKLSAIFTALLIMGCFGQTLLAPSDSQIEASESSIVGMIVGALVGVVVAVALIPTIANQTTTLETDTAGDLDTAEEDLVGLWPLLIIVGVMMAIIGLAL